MNSYGYAGGNPLKFTDPSGQAIWVPLLAAYEVYSYAQTYVDYVNFRTATTYPEAHTIEQIDQAGSKLLLDIWLGGVSRFGTDVEQLMLDVGGFVTDVTEMYCASYTCKKIDPTVNKLPQQTTRNPSGGSSSNSSSLNFSQPSSGFTSSSINSVTSHSGGGFTASFQNQIVQLTTQMLGSIDNNSPYIGIISQINAYNYSLTAASNNHN